MEGKIVPNNLFVLKPFYINFFENMKLFQFSHRLLGSVLLLYSGWFFIKTQSEFYNKYSGILFMSLLIQFYLGIMTLLLKVPLLLGVIHQGMAACILLVIIHIIFLMTHCKPINR